VKQTDNGATGASGGLRAAINVLDISMLPSSPCIAASGADTIKGCRPAG
jgi:hypothetical protein